MAWQYPVTAPFPWTDGSNIAHAADFSAIASDIQNWGGAVGASGYGLAGAAFLTLVPGDLPGNSYTVTAASWSSGSVTLTIGANNLQIGQHFTLTGVTPTTYNNGATNGSTTNPPDYVVTAIPTANSQIKFALATNPGTWSSGGTVLVDGTASPAVGMLATNASGALQQWNGSAWVTIPLAAYAQITLANGANENITIPSAQLVFLAIVGPTSAYSIGGFAGGYPGQRIQIFNDTSQAMTINNLDAGSSAINQIHTCTGANVTGAQCADFTYLDSGGNIWLVTGHNP